MVLAVINGHVDVTADEALAIALWILLTHHADKFEYSPRLALLSPVKGCGKTTVLKALRHLCMRPRLMNSVTPALIYRVIDREHPTLLIDEGDNLGLNINPTIRTIMNSGHNVGSSVGRVIKGEPKEYDTFGPLAIGAIGTLPLTLMDRSIIVHMEKSQRRDLRRLDPYSPNIKVVDAVYREICKWARTPQLTNIDAILPGDRTRHADNWRPLIAVADGFGKAWGRKARAAASAYKLNYSDDDLRVILLTDIRTAFDRLNVDRIASKQLVVEVRAINDLWDACPGPRGTHTLTTGSMAALLRPFRPAIRSVTIWRPSRKRGDSTGSGKGYLRSAFATAWAKYKRARCVGQGAGDSLRCVGVSIGLNREVYPSLICSTHRHTSNKEEMTMSNELSNKTAAVSLETVEQFLTARKLTSVGGRLLFGIDATASRQESWNVACRSQADMFREAGEGLSVSLIYFRGDGECKATPWVTSAETLVRAMRKIEVLTGMTQIGKILRHALREHEQASVQAVIYVGDAMEESIDELSGLATKLGAQKLPAYMFQEGKDDEVERAFKLIAKNSGGAYFKFGTDSPQAVAQFSDTLNAVAKLATGDSSAIAAITHKKGE
jgi:hypothetical protein